MNNDKYSVVEERSRRIKDWLDGKLSPQEIRTLEKWAEQRPANKELLERVNDVRGLADRINFCARNDKEAGWKAIQQKLRRPSLFVRSVRYAAVAVLVLAMGLSVYYALNPEVEPVTVVTNSLPEPGNTRAYLQLATGEHYILDSLKSIDTQVKGAQLKTEKTGRLVVTGHEKDSVEEQTEYLRIVVPTAGDYNMLLADGTCIWINSCSELEFPARFIGDERRIRLLKGEAYFEVAKNTEQPFVLEVEDKEIRVLGTSFNVNTYDNEFATTLVTGKVEVTVDHRKYALTPDRQLRIDDGQVTIKEVDPYEFTAWRDGTFVFKYQSLEKVLATLARWYDIQVVFSKEELKKFHYTGKIERHSDIRELLQFLQKTGSVQFSLEGQILIVSE